MMTDFASISSAKAAASTLLVLFIPSKNRSDQPIDQPYWINEALRTLGMLFGGATAFPRGKGIWRDDSREGELLLDETVIIQCHMSEPLLREKAPALREFLHRMGREARQGAVGLVIDRDYLEIGFPLEASNPSPGKARKRR